MLSICVNIKRALTSFLPTILILAIAVFHFVNVYNHAVRINDYISDECWYVSSARNLLVNIFRGTPIYVSDDGLIGINVLLSDYVNTYLVIHEILSSGGKVVKQDYREVQLIYAEVKDLDIIHRLSRMSNVVSVIPGYRYPDSGRITQYLNTEHPPLGKYFITASIAVCGDKPLCWRFPSITASCIIVVVVYLLVRSVIGGSTGSYLGLVAALLTSLDTLFRSLSVVAMLDIYVSLFTITTLYLLIKRKVHIASSNLGLSFISKYTGSFAAPAIIYYMIKGGMKPIKAILYLVCIPLSFLIVSSAPLIITLGFQQWWLESVENAVRWHLSIKTLSGPPTSAPWEWLIGSNPFILHYDYVNGEWVPDLIAKGNNVIYLVSTALTLFILPKIKKLPDGGMTSIYVWGIFSMYVLIWIIGSRTQYSFYMVQLTPLLYCSLMVQLFWITSGSNFIELLRKWREIIVSVVKWLYGDLIINIYVKIEDKNPSANP
ncbi:MAG: glycosyltransferase family 39 protein [Sulfolobales archaeon]|nr:glycosyltransferase family 39 protein [Sulfolobales archaeon]